MKRLPNFPIQAAAFILSRWPDGSLRWKPYKSGERHAKRDHNFEIAMRRAARLGRRLFDKLHPPLLHYAGR